MVYSNDKFPFMNFLAKKHTAILVMVVYKDCTYFSCTYMHCDNTKSKDRSHRSYIRYIQVTSFHLCVLLSVCLFRTLVFLGHHTKAICGI